MTTEVSPYRRPKEEGPAPGQYDRHLTGFGEDVTMNIGMGSKYKFKPDQNPPPGLYNPESPIDSTKPKSRSVHITKETHPERRPKESSPAQGQYDSPLKPFS